MGRKGAPDVAMIRSRSPLTDEPPYSRIQLAKRSGRCIARVGKRLLATFRHSSIQGLEIIQPHVHLAADHQTVGKPGLRHQMERQ